MSALNSLIIVIPLLNVLIWRMEDLNVVVLKAMKEMEDSALVHLLRHY